MTDNKPLTIISTLFRVWSSFGRAIRFKFIFLIIITFFSAFAEVLSLGAVVPFLGLLINTETMYNNDQVIWLINFLNLEAGPHLVGIATFFFCFFIFLAFLFRVFLLWYQTKLSSKAGIEISINIYERVLNQEYHVHLNRNSSDIVAIITNKVNNVVSGGIFPAISILSSIPISISILLLVFFIDISLAVTVFFSVGIGYLSIVFLTKSLLIKLGDKINIHATKVVKSLQEGLGSIRNIILDNLQKPYINLFVTYQTNLRDSVANTQIIGALPRYFLEALGVIIISLIGYSYWLSNDNITDKIPVLAAIAVAAQRLLPLLQQSFSGWTAIKSSLASIDDAISILEEPITFVSPNKREKIDFKNWIYFKNISYKYENANDYVFKNIELKIKKGSLIGIIGKTGSGKSTLVDIISGMLTPSNGSIIIDNKKITRENYFYWRKKIAYVPQTVFLSDISIQENIALSSFGAKLDEDKVQKVAIQAKISEYINNTAHKYNTIVGESGSKLSGGQRQRIGIARALYKDAELIIFDEATSALDKSTEAAILSEVKLLKNKKTIIIISHSSESLIYCDEILEIKNGKIYISK
jgi:ATP-binding cassette, subfamily B, bacterial PglK